MGTPQTMPFTLPIKSEITTPTLFSPNKGGRLGAAGRTAQAAMLAAHATCRAADCARGPNSPQLTP